MAKFVNWEEWRNYANDVWVLSKLRKKNGTTILWWGDKE